MNKITSFFLLIAILCLLVHAINLIICLKRWLPMKKGKAEKRPFITKTNLIILWIAAIGFYVAVSFFCVFFSTDAMGKARLFGEILLLSPAHPVCLLIAGGYGYLFHYNRVFSQEETRGKN